MPDAHQLSVQRQVIGAARRKRLGTLLGADLRRVRFQVSPLPDAVGALAFACGRRVVQSETAAALRGRALHRVLAHELAHVLQQHQGATAAWRGRIANSPRLEREAERCARRLSAGLPARLAPRTRHRPAACIQRIKLALKLDEKTTLDAPRLLYLVDCALQKFIAACPKSPTAAKEARTYLINNPAAWGALLGRLFSYGVELPGGMERTSLLDCSLALGPYTLPVLKTEGTERIVFPEGATAFAGAEKGDLNYVQIAKAFAKLAGSFDEDKIAEVMLHITTGKRPPDMGLEKEHLEFLVGMVMLMFGVEASRFPSALLSSLFLLDLVRSKCTYGSAGTKRFTLARAFDKPDVNFDFDCAYGGKFPCAVHNPGPGNGSNRTMLGKVGGQKYASDTHKDAPKLYNRADWAKMTMELNHRFIVPRREVTLLIHWIEAMTNMKNVSEASVLALIENRWKYFLAGKIPAVLPHMPLKTTGTHAGRPGGVKPSVADLQKETQPVYFTDRGAFFHSIGECKMLGQHGSGMAKLYAKGFVQTAHKDKAKTNGLLPVPELKTLKLTAENHLLLTTGSEEGGLRAKTRCTHCVA